MAKLRKNLSLARELLQTKVVMMEANALANYRQQLLSNFNQHISAESILDDILPNERHYMLTYRKDTREVTAVQFFDENNMLVEEDANGDMVTAHEPKEDEQRVLMLELTGPVTRCGGMCSYGSMDMRDILLEYAGDDSVAGLVLITDTPGGTAFALHDFAQGMEAWNAAGKRSIQWIDGMSCSAGVACGCQCQKVIAMHPKDVVGCIGAMMAGFMIADGTVDQNGMRYVDVTASQTPDKNGEFRAAASGDYEALQKEVDACCEDFLATIERCRPQIKPDQRTGHTYDAGSVIGSLVDGIGDLNSAINYCLTGEESWQSQTVQPTQPSVEGEPESKCKPKDGCGDPEKKDKCKPKDGCPCDPEEDPDRDPEDENEGSQDANNQSGEQSLDNTNTENSMTQIEAQRIADRTGMTVEEVYATIAEPVAQTEEPAAQTEEAVAPAEPAAQVEEPEPAQTEEPAAPAEPAAQVEEPVAQAEEPAVEPTTQNEEPEPVQTEEPAAPAEPAVQVEEPAPAEPEQAEEPAAPAEDPTLAVLNALQQQMTQMQSQFTALQQQHQQTEQQLADTQRQLQAARQETADLRAAAPAPAMPAAPAHSPAASTVATRINENMTAKEKLEAYKKRGEQLKRNR